MSRPVPVSGQLETSIVDFGVWKRRALADERIDRTEADELLVITERMVRNGNLLLRSITFVTRILTGKEGMDSTCVRRQWDERQAELAYLEDYRPSEPKDAA
jgi:hypothetical protein